MKAAVVEEYGKPMVIHRDVADPECGPDDATVKFRACGICRSDHTLGTGGFPWVGIVPPLPLVLGHEYCGVVVAEVGANLRSVRPGDRVVSPFGHACGPCQFCDRLRELLGGGGRWGSETGRYVPWPNRSNTRCVGNTPSQTIAGGFRWSSAH